MPEKNQLFLVGLLIVHDKDFVTFREEEKALLMPSNKVSIEVLVSD